MNLESIWGRNYGQRLSDMEIMKLRAMEIMGVRIKITKKKLSKVIGLITGRDGEKTQCAY